MLMQEVRQILGSDLPFEVVSMKLDLPELQVRITCLRSSSRAFSEVEVAGGEVAG
jgi:hypothetical protein